MRRIISFFILIALFSLVNGQSLKIGVFADPKIGWFSPESKTIRSDGVKSGIEAGLLLDRYFQENYAFQTGISIGNQGGNLLFPDKVAFTSYGETDTLDEGASVEYKLNYITVPLGLRLKTKQIGYFSYFIRLGFTNQFNTKAQVTSSDGELDDNTIEKAILFYDLSYYFGVGAQYNINKDQALNFGLTYNNGIINISREDNFKLYSRGVSLRVGFIF